MAEVTKIIKEPYLDCNYWWTCVEYTHDGKVGQTYIQSNSKEEAETISVGYIL